jgi:hypothetical protein
VLHNHIEEARDPDLEQAIEDLREVVVELREKSAALTATRMNRQQRADAQAYIGELYSRLAVRAERLGLSSDELLTVINGALDSHAAVVVAIPPAAPTTRHNDELTAAESRLATADEQARAWLVERRAAVLAVRAARGAL